MSIAFLCVSALAQSTIYDHVWLARLKYAASSWFLSHDEKQRWARWARKLIAFFVFLKEFGCYEGGHETGVRETCPLPLRATQIY